jgi:hypothetical protein
VVIDPSGLRHSIVNLGHYLLRRFGFVHNSGKKQNPCQ